MRPADAFSVYGQDGFDIISRFDYFSSLLQLPPPTNHIQSLNDGSKFIEAGRSTAASLSRLVEVSPRVLPKCSRSALEVDSGSLVSIAFAEETAEKSKPVEVTHAPVEVELAVFSKCSRSALEVCFEVADWLLEWLAGWFVRPALVAHAMNLSSRANV